jgi:hypothetical protein
MKLELYAAGYSTTDHGMKRAGCGIRLECIHDDGRVQHRSLSFRLGQATAALANLRAAQLAILALRRLPPTAPTTLHVDRYVATMLEHQGGRYKAIPSVNQVAVTALRQVYERCQHPAIVIVKPTELPECLGLAKEATTAQQNTDSGTYIAGEAKDEQSPRAS